MAWVAFDRAAKEYAAGAGVDVIHKTGNEAQFG
jgi:hypothetical protein